MTEAPGTGAADDGAAKDADPRRELRERWSKAIGRPEKTVRIGDPQAIRAIAHEARQRVIDTLFTDNGRSYTATALAGLTGLSPSAMSYHLRALEKFGVIERADDAGDGRNRPWRAAGTRLEVRGGGDPAGSAAQSVLMDLTLDQLRRRLVAYFRWPADRKSNAYIGTGEGELWLTEAESATLVLALERAELELFENGLVNEPGPGKVRTRFLWSLLPTQDQPPPS